MLNRALRLSDQLDLWPTEFTSALRSDLAKTDREYEAMKAATANHKRLGILDPKIGAAVNAMMERSKRSARQIIVRVSVQANVDTAELKRKIEVDNPVNLEPRRKIDRSTLAGELEFQSEEQRRPGRDASVVAKRNAVVARTYEQATKKYYTSVIPKVREEIDADTAAHERELLDLLPHDR